jgi:hypothetical protein
VCTYVGKINPSFQSHINSKTTLNIFQARGNKIFPSKSRTYSVFLKRQSYKRKEREKSKLLLNSLMLHNFSRNITVKQCSLIYVNEINLESSHKLTYNTYGLFHQTIFYFIGLNSELLYVLASPCCIFAAITRCYNKRINPPPFLSLHYPWINKTAHAFAWENVAQSEKMLISRYLETTALLWRDSISLALH